MTLPAYRPAPPAHRMTPERPQVRRTLLWVAVVVVLVVCGLIAAVVVGLTTGPVGALVGLVLALLPVFPVAASLLWVDRFEAEPRSLLAFTFAWGATAAIVISLVVSLPVAAVIEAGGGGPETSAVLVAPVVEEIAKGMAVVGVLLIRRREFDGVVDGIVYAGLVGLGFAFVENILYLGGAFLEGGVPGAVGLFALRGVMSPFAHPLFTMAFGVGVGMAVRSRGSGRVVFPLVGLAVAIGLHALWNLSAVMAAGERFFGLYLALQVPIFVVAVTLAVLARRREGRLIATHLQVYAGSGWLADHEVTMLASTTGRRQARNWAARSAGPSGQRAMKAFQELGSELAFLRERTHHGAAPADADETELDLLQSMWELRRQFAPRGA